MEIPDSDIFEPAPGRRINKWNILMKSTRKCKNRKWRNAINEGNAQKAQESGKVENEEIK